MGCSGSGEANSIYEAKKHSIPLPTENVILRRDVARACTQCGKSANRVGAVGTTGVMTLFSKGGRKAEGVPLQSAPENMLQQVTKQLNYKQQKNNEAVRGSQYFFFFPDQILPNSSNLPL